MIDAAERAEKAGLRVVGLHVDPDWSECFIHPSSANGTVVQLANWSENYARPTSLEEVLAGEAGTGKSVSGS